MTKMRQIAAVLGLLLSLSVTTIAQTYSWSGSPSFTFPQAHPRLWIPAGSAQFTQAQTWAMANPVANCASTGFTSVEMICYAFYHVTTGTSCSTAITWATNWNQSAPVLGWPPSASQTTTTAAGSDAQRDDGEAVNLIFDWCYDALTAPQISTWVSTWQGWLFNIDQQCHGGYTQNGCSVNQDTGNYYHGMLRDDLEWGIASYGDNGTGSGSAADNDISAGITRWADLKADFSSAEAGGYGFEGTEYGRSYAYFMIPFETIGLGGRDIIDEIPWMRDYSVSQIYDTTPTTTLNSIAAHTSFAQMEVSDDQYWSQDTWSVFHFLFEYQEWLNFASNYYHSAGTSGSLVRLLYNTVVADSNTLKVYGFNTTPWVLALDNAPSAAANYSSLPLDDYIVGNRYAFLHDAWSTTGPAVLLQLSQMQPPNGNHVHNDVGNFTIWRNGYFRGPGDNRIRRCNYRRAEHDGQRLHSRGRAAGHISSGITSSPSRTSR